LEGQRKRTLLVLFFRRLLSVFLLLRQGECDTLKLALVLKDKRKDKFTQQEEAKALLKKCGLDHLIGIEKNRDLVPVLDRGKVLMFAKQQNKNLFKPGIKTLRKTPAKAQPFLLLVTEI
jgi:hypothetical protein